MKKVLAASAALLMAGSIATAAEMDDQTGVKITGNARARVIYKDSYDYGNSNADSNMTMDSRVRFVVTGTAAGGSYITSRIRLMDTKFAGDESASEDKNIWADWAYIGVPLTDTFKVEAGKYRAFYGNGFMYDDIGLGGVRGVYKTEQVEVIPFYNIMSEGQLSSNSQDVEEDNDIANFGGVVTVDVQDWTMGVMAAYQYDDTADVRDETNALVSEGGTNEGFFTTLFAKGAMGAFGLEGEFSYAESGLEDFTGADDGYGGYVRASFNMDALTLALDLGGTVDGFTPDPFYGFVMIGGEEPINAEAIGETGDWTWVGLRTTYAVSEALSLTGNLVYANVDGNDDLGADDPRLAKLYEVSGVLQYAVSKGTTFSWFAGYLQPDFDGRLDAVGVEDDAAFGTYAKFDVKF